MWTYIDFLPILSSIEVKEGEMRTKKKKSETLMAVSKVTNIPGLLTEDTQALSLIRGCALAFFVYFIDFAV